MKLLLYTDCHWSENSSIIRSRGEKYTKRLENLILSINWAESVAGKYDCDMVICLGDFFDKPNLTAQEITALTDIEWIDLPHYFLVGNHDANINDLSYASTFVFNKPNFHIISQPTYLPLADIKNDTSIYLLPYIIESNRKNLTSYFTSNSAFGNKIVLSHNDLAGVRYGNFISTNGFNIDEIEKNCSLFINGHLHNAGFVNESETILNLGNLTGQNFSEDATTYRHYCVILDTDTLDLTFFENPYAFNFYKIVVENESQISLLSSIGPNAVVSIHCGQNILPQVKYKLENSNNIVESRVSVSLDSLNIENVEISELASVDYLKQFSDYILTHLDNSDILREELSNIIV